MVFFKILQIIYRKSWRVLQILAVFDRKTHHVIKGNFISFQIFTVCGQLSCNRIGVLILYLCSFIDLGFVISLCASFLFCIIFENVDIFISNPIPPEF